MPQPRAVSRSAPGRLNASRGFEASQLVVLHRGTFCGADVITEAVLVPECCRCFVGVVDMRQGISGLFDDDGDL